MPISFDITRRRGLRLAAGSLVLALAVLAAPASVRAADYPERPVTVVVPFATGGYNDRLARAFAPFLQKHLGQPVTIVNRPGAGAQLGHTYFLQQPDDGYTILCTSAAPYIPLNILLQNAPYKTGDFHMINLPSNDFTLAATAADKPFKSFQEVMDKLKQDPGSLSIGVQPASADYANMVLLMKAEGIDVGKLRIVTYDGGGPARNATAGGHVDVGLVGGEGFLPIKEKIRPLAVFNDTRVPDFKDAPSIEEFAKTRGYDVEYVAGSQRGWAVQSSFKAKHPDRYKTLEQAIEKASKDPEAIKALEAQQLATEWFGPEKSNAAFKLTAERMERHIDLLRAK